MDTITAEQTKALILKAFDTLFNKRKYAKAAEFWSDNYIQHNGGRRLGDDARPISWQRPPAPTDCR